jgi:DNA-binding IclR family transcriptional regulator
MLAEETGETALVARRVGSSAVCLLQVESERPLRVSVAPGSLLPLHTDAVGRTLLAFAPPELVDEVIAQELSSREDGDVEELRGALREIAETGRAISEGDADGVVTMAVPILREDGIVGALVVTGPASRCGLAWRTRAKRALTAGTRALAAELNEALG